MPIDVNRAKIMCCPQAGVFLEPGVVTEAILYEGDAGYAPRGSAHYFTNIGNTDAYVILIFDGGQFTNTDVTSLIANVPPQASGLSAWGHAVPDTIL